MAKRQRPFLSLECLEDRWVPTNVRFDGSNLTISNLNIVGGSSSLTVTQLASGAFQVKDNGATEGSYFVRNNLTINTGGGNDTVAIMLNNAAGAAGTLPGNLAITTGNGNDTVTLNVAATGGTIGGNFSLSFGTGADLFESEPAAGSTSSLTIGGSVNISGMAGPGVLNVPALGSGSPIPAHNYVEFNQLTPNTGQSTFIGGNVNVRNIVETNLGAFSATPIGAPRTSSSMFIGGNVNIQLSALAADFSNPQVTGTATPYANFVVSSVQTKIGGSENITGATGDNYILADSNVGGSIVANLGVGNNVLDVNLNVATGQPGKPMTVGKDIDFNASNGNNTLLFDDSVNPPPNGPNPLLVGGSVNVNFGNGSNSVQFTNDTVPGGDVFINGNFSYRAGNGSNTIAMGTPAFAPVQGNIPFIASVNGSESFSLGNGTDSVTVGTAPGGALNINVGNGNDSVTLDNASVNGTTAQNYFNFLTVFGNGNDTFTLGDPSTGAGALSGGPTSPVVASGSVIGGSGSNTFVQQPNATPIANAFFLKNF